MSTIPLIILTTSVYTKNIVGMKQCDPEARLECYLKSIKNWIENTKLNIILVENTGYKFNEFKEFENNRFEIITFTRNDISATDQAFLFNTNRNEGRSKGQHELYEINYVYNNSKILKNINPTHIIKITGRYYIPDFESIINEKLRLEHLAIFQQFPMPCEISGCHINYFSELFKFPAVMKIDLVEEVYFNRKALFTKNINNSKRFTKEALEDDDKLILPKLKLAYPVQQGGTHTIMQNL